MTSPALPAATWAHPTAELDLRAFLDALAQGPYLPLYLLTLALHALFVSYLVGGTLYVAGAHGARWWRARRGLPHALAPLPAAVASWLPLTMGGAITAGVAPLLFLQVLYQRPFYTANLLLGPVWMAMVPALIAGFYLLYLHKARAGASPGQALALLGAALACFALVAALWSANHAMMTAPARWLAAYTDRQGALDPRAALRLLLALGVMMAQAALLAAWQARALASSPASADATVPLAPSTADAASEPHRDTTGAASEPHRDTADAASEPYRDTASATNRDAADAASEQHRGTTAALARTAIGGRALALLAAALLGLAPTTSPLTFALTALAAVDLTLWLLLARRAARPARGAHLRALTATTLALLALGLVQRELPRLPHLRALPANVTSAGGAWLFAMFAALAIVALTALIRTARRAAAASLERSPSRS